MSKNKNIYICEGVTVYPKKNFTIEEIEHRFKELDEKATEWKNWISDEEYERRFHKPKFGNHKIIGERYIRFKPQYDPPNQYGEFFSDVPYLVPYFTEKLGRGAIPVYVTNEEEFEDFDVFSSYQDDMEKKQ